MTRYLKAFLEELAYVIETLSRYNPYTSVDPLLLFIGSLALTITASFASRLEALVIPLLYSLTLLAYARPGAGRVARVLAPIVFLSLTASTPLLFTSTGRVESLASLQASPSREGFESFVVLLARTITAPLPLVALFSYTGWFTVSSRLRRIPVVGSIARLVDLTLVLIPRTARHLTSLLLAREARIVRQSLSLSWKSLAASTGDMLVHSISYSEKLYLALTARSVGGGAASLDSLFKPTLANIIYTIIITVLVAVEVVVLLWPPF